MPVEKEKNIGTSTRGKHLNLTNKGMMMIVVVVVVVVAAVWEMEQ